ncbi:hypothetical protein SO802_034489 [Lithocarpus litseifolius]|uniref:Uncharacterized protein n=1 Tax=Lithocarpus litseifolius TaxID=425828 RepID=A0AAW2BJE5_9ROSI
MKDKGIVDKISTSVKKEIREKWMNLDEDSKLEYKKEARENSEKYANLSHNIPRKSRKVSLYTRCAPNRVRLMALNLNESQRFVIREMGFGSMLDLRSIQLDRDFCKWLVDHFDHNSCALDICGRRLPISTKDVEFILGIKSSGVDVSTVAGAEEINHICQQHGLNVLFYFEHVNVEMNLEHVSKRLQPRICYWGKKEVNQRMLKLHSIGSFDSPKLVVTEMDGGHETKNIPLEKQNINESHAMPSQYEDKPNMGSDEAILRIEQSITSLRDEMLVMQKTVIDIANNMDSFKNDILLELKKIAREHNGHSNDLNLNDIVDV